VPAARAAQSVGKAAYTPRAARGECPRGARTVGSLATGLFLFLFHEEKKERSAMMREQRDAAAGKKIHCTPVFRTV
jgi:hypothetical protein